LRFERERERVEILSKISNIVKSIEV